MLQCFHQLVGKFAVWCLVIMTLSELYSGNKSVSTDDPDCGNTNESGVTERKQFV